MPRPNVARPSIARHFRDQADTPIIASQLNALDGGLRPSAVPGSVLVSGVTYARVVITTGVITWGGVRRLVSPEEEILCANGATTLIWYGGGDGGGTPAIYSGTSWPEYRHIPLAQAVVSNGVITSLADTRPIHSGDLQLVEFFISGAVAIGNTDLRAWMHTGVLVGWGIVTGSGTGPAGGTLDVDIQTLPGAASIFSAAADRPVVPDGDEAAFASPAAWSGAQPVVAPGALQAAVIATNGTVDMSVTLAFTV